MKYPAVFIFIKSTVTGSLITHIRLHAIIIIYFSINNIFRPERNMKIEIEIIFIRRNPFESPAHAFSKSFNFFKWRTGYSYICYVVIIEMHQCCLGMIRAKRTTHTTFFPPGSKHKMLYDQLTSAIKEISECFFAAGSVKYI